MLAHLDYDGMGYVGYIVKKIVDITLQEIPGVIKPGFLQVASVLE